MANDDLLKIHCTTTVTLRNTQTNYVYADEAEKDADVADPNTSTQAADIAQDVQVEVSPKGLEVLKRILNQNNE
tara:strand:- start:237 stop:458 length:222 start_codon:yes stop_codon:yes gene_type:complete